MSLTRLRRAHPVARALLAAAVLCAPAASLGAGSTPAPAFRAVDEEGRAIELAELLGRGPVLLDFWSTWCKPCAIAMPEIEAIHREFSPKGLTVVGISIDGPRNHAKVRPFVARLGLTYPIVVDADGSLQQRFQVRAVPTAVLIDTSGVIVRTNQGYRPGDEDALRDAIRALISDTSGAAGAGPGEPAE